GGQGSTRVPAWPHNEKSETWNGTTTGGRADRRGWAGRARARAGARAARRVVHRVRAEPGTAGLPQGELDDLAHHGALSPARAPCRDPQAWAARRLHARHFLSPP